MTRSQDTDNTASTSSSEWAHLAQRASAAIHDLIGWIIFDPRAKDNYANLGIPDGMGYYVATRFGPIIAAGADATGASGYSINNAFIGVGIDLMDEHTTAEAAMTARDAAVLPGLDEVAPSLKGGLGAYAGPIWKLVDDLPNCGRVLFGAHRGRENRESDNSALSAWLAFNCLREWRGDTHWALCVAADLDGAEVGLMHNAMVKYDDGEWIARSRGASDDEIDVAWQRLEEKGFAVDKSLTELGIQTRVDIETRTDELCARVWRTYGEANTMALLGWLEPYHEAFMAKIEATAGPNWMPAARYK